MSAAAAPRLLQQHPILAAAHPGGGRLRSCEEVKWARLLTRGAGLLVIDITRPTVQVHEITLSSSFLASVSRLERLFLSRTPDGQHDARCLPRVTRHARVLPHQTRGGLTRFPGARLPPNCFDIRPFEWVDNM